MGEEVTNYIKAELASGKSKNEIINRLKSRGWTEVQANEAFSQAQGQTTPKPSGVPNASPKTSELPRQEIYSSNMPSDIYPAAVSGLASDEKIIRSPSSHPSTHPAIDHKRPATRPLPDYALIGKNKELVIPEETKSSVPETVEDDEARFTTTKALLLLGAVLMVLGVGITFLSMAEALKPWTRIGFLVAPMVLMFATAFGVAKRKEFIEIYNVSLGLGAALFPFAIASIIIQTKISQDADLIILISFAWALVLYFILEFLFKRWFFAVFTLAAFYIVAGALVVMGQPKVQDIAWTLPAVSILVFIAGLILDSLKKKDGNIFAIWGALGFTIYLPAIVIFYVNYQAPQTIQTNVVIFATFGISYLILASILNYFRIEYKNSTLYKIKRYLEEIAPFMVILPFFLAVFIPNTITQNLGKTSSPEKFLHEFLTDQHRMLANLIVIIALSILAIFLCTKARIKSLIYAGAFGLIGAIFAITFIYYHKSFGWPIGLLVTGLVVIWLSLVAKKVSLFPNKTERLFLGLGEDPNETRKGIRFGLLEILGYRTIGGFVWVAIIMVFLIISASSFISMFGRSYLDNYLNGVDSPYVYPSSFPTPASYLTPYGYPTANAFPTAYPYQTSYPYPTAYPYPTVYPYQTSYPTPSGTYQD